MKPARLARFLEDSGLIRKLCASCVQWGFTSLWIHPGIRRKFQVVLDEEGSDPMRLFALGPTRYWRDSGNFMLVHPSDMETPTFSIP